MSSERSPKYIYAQERVVITLECIEKIKTLKKRQQNSLKNIFFTNGVKKTATNTVMTFRLRLAAYNRMII